MLIALSFLFSLDSLFASFVLGVFRVERTRPLKLALALGICDGVASFIRGALGPADANVSWVTSPQFHLALRTYLIAIFLVWLFGAAKWFRSPLLWTIPVALGVDNLAGPLIAPLSLASVTWIAFASVFMSLAGFRLGTFLAGVAHNVGLQRPLARRVAR
jgi:hypothetical protein